MAPSRQPPATTRAAHTLAFVISYEWRGAFTNDEVNALHAEAFGQRLDDGWQSQLHRHSLGWVCARDDAGLAGFVNVAWNGGAASSPPPPACSPCSVVRPELGPHRRPPQPHRHQQQHQPQKPCCR
jgi:hypothetical protein